MSGHHGSRDARRRAILHKRFPFGTGDYPGDERSFAQLRRDDGPLRIPGGPSPADVLRRRIADDGLRVALRRRTLPW